MALAIGILDQVLIRRVLGNLNPYIHIDGFAVNEMG